MAGIRSGAGIAHDTAEHAPPLAVVVRVVAAGARETIAADARSHTHEHRGIARGIGFGELQRRALQAATHQPRHVELTAGRVFGTRVAVVWLRRQARSTQELVGFFRASEAREAAARVAGLSFAIALHAGAALIRAGGATEAEGALVAAPADAVRGHSADEDTAALLTGELVAEWARRQRFGEEGEAGVHAPEVHSHQLVAGQSEVQQAETLRELPFIGNDSGVEGGIELRLETLALAAEREGGRGPCQADDVEALGIFFSFALSFALPFALPFALGDRDLTACQRKEEPKHRHSENEASHEATSETTHPTPSHEEKDERHSEGR